MAFIHELPDWPDISWDSETLAMPLAEVRHKQGRLLGRMESLGFDFRSEASLETLTSEVIKTSAIENENLDTAEVRSSVARRLGIDTGGLPKASRQVDGVVEMMFDATTNFAAELSEERLFGWHTSLFPTGRKGLTPLTVGQWRSAESGPMQVVSGPLGKERVHFAAPAAERVPTEMQRFLTWFNARQSMDSVLKSGVAHFWFVTIHPFEDGNGRIARAIADMELARSDGTKDRFYSMSAQIEAGRKDYYWQLESAQRGELDITSWLEWYLGCLGRAIISAEAGLTQVLRKARLWQQFNNYSLNERQRLVINRLLDGFQGFLTTSKYAKLAKCSSDTALRDIQQLLQHNILVSNPGRGRSTSYRLADTE